MDEAKDYILNNVLKIIPEIIQSIATFNAMESMLDDNLNNNSFINLYNNNAMMIIIRVCNVFGTDSEDNHWKKIVDNEDDFRNNVILRVFKDLEEWNMFHNNLVNFRKKYCVHMVPEDIESSLSKMDTIYLLLKDTMIYFSNKYGLIPSCTSDSIDDVFNSEKSASMKLFR